MTYTEAYKEQIVYTFHSFCKVVIRHAAITALRDQHRRRQKEISLEYLTEEKFYPLGTKWGILTFCHMKRLFGRPTENRKPWTRFYSITVHPNCRH